METETHEDVGREFLEERENEFITLIDINNDGEATPDEIRVRCIFLLTCIFTPSPHYSHTYMYIHFISIILIYTPTFNFFVICVDFVKNHFLNQYVERRSVVLCYLVI